jgi:hypothetical protein
MHAANLRAPETLFTLARRREALIPELTVRWFALSIKPVYPEIPGLGTADRENQQLCARVPHCCELPERFP